MSPLRLGIMLSCLATMLSACGGGGGRSGTLPQTIPPQTIPSTSTYFSMVAEVSAIRGASDSLLMTDVFLTHPGLPRGDRSQTFCGSGFCQAYYDGYRLFGISLLDFQLSDRMDDHQFFSSLRGIKMVDVRGRDEEAGVATDFNTLGGWLNKSAFGVTVNSIVSGVSDGVGLRGTGFAVAYSLGDATGTTPAFGNATWTGTMVGGDTSLTAYRGNRIMGDATLTFDLSQSDIDVTFTNIRDIDAGRPHGLITWQNIPVTSGSFSRGFIGNSIDGRFYGPNHEEVGGIFERNQIAGSFGAKR
ncbi:MAG: transferrin-binding protein-like solute binding protein [Nitrospira sp. SB0662_bin_26]|nr:transferrin-binding protein-like solute binding protein [Nitrospira sp. SB0662_bin_26]